jgi:festuclavine dehydrogenase
MSTKSTKGTVLLLGGTGKVSSRIAPLLSSNGYSVLLASRSGKAPSLPNCHGIKFDWFDQSTYASPFKTATNISSIFIVAPPIVDQLPLTKAFIDLAITEGVKRGVLLSGSVLPVGDGPMMGVLSKYLISLDVEYAILRPSWFMENFSEVEHYRTILEEDRIVTAAGDGKVPFVSAHDIANVAYRALTDEVPHNTDHLILGPGLFSYDEVSSIVLLMECHGWKLTL